MQVVYDFLLSIPFFYNYPLFIDILVFLVYALVVYLCFGKVGLINLIKGGIKKLITYKKGLNVNDKGESLTVGQKFERFKPVYRLNKTTGLLEKTEDIVDIQEMIDSSKDCALNRALERFIPVDEVDDRIYEADSMKDDLDLMRESFELADNYRSKYHLPDTMTPTEVFSFVSKKASELGDAIKSAQQNKQGGASNEAKTETEQKSEQA